MVDKDLVQRKISLIQEDLQHLTKYEHLKFNEMAKDFMTRAVIERLLERTIGRVLDINQHLIAECGGHLETIKRYRDTFLRLVDIGVYPLPFAEKIAKCAGLRNALVHDYNNIDPQILQKSIQEAIKEFNEYTQFILKFLDKKC